LVNNKGVDPNEWRKSVSKEQYQLVENNLVKTTPKSL
jgi:hypothetical protein